MKKTKKSGKVMFLGVLIAIGVIAIAGMNMRTIIDSRGITRIARQTGANDAEVGDALENYTFTSDTAGVGVAGSITDYSKQLKQIKLTAASANRVVTLDLDDGYYTQINVDTTDVYNKGYDDGVEETLKLDGPWGYDHETQTVTNGNLTFNIGDYIYYRAPSASGYSGKWKLLGVDSKGQMLLVSSENVGAQTFSGDSIGNLENAVQVLNSKCEKYADGINAENGRSIRVEDVNKITGYNPLNVGVDDPEQIGIGVPCLNGTFDQYGSCVRIKVNGNVTEEVEGYPVENTPTSIVHYWFTPSWEGNKSIYIYKNERYYYFPQTLSESLTGELKGIDTSSKAYNMLFGLAYWLGNKYVHPKYSNGDDPTATASEVNFGLRYVGEYGGSKYVGTKRVWSSWLGSETQSSGIRAVVALKLSAKPILEE